jgi:Zn-dependent protease with chaperone function
MSYDNPPVPHEVNVSAQKPVREFFRLAGGVLLLVALIVGAVYIGARLFAPYVPFRYETVINHYFWKDEDTAALSPCEQEGTQALQNLADALAGRMGLPEDMRIRVHFVDEDIPNAYATLGGNVVIYRGVLENIESENALAMVLAHEIAHIKHRDPIVSLGGGVTVGLLFSALIGGSDGGALVSWGMGLTQLSFSRDQENAADAAAIAALKAHYGYSNGADEFFNYVTRQEDIFGEKHTPAFLSAHPASSARLRDIQASFDAKTQALTPLPEAIRRLRQPCSKE